jgi:TPR repeat protein
MKHLIAAAILILAVAAPARADSDKGDAAYGAGAYATAYGEWQPLAEQGDANAQYGLGLLYATGRGLPQDDDQAFKWFLRSAEQGVAKAEFLVGLMYAQGRGVTQDEGEAVAWYRRAADQEFATAAPPSRNSPRPSTISASPTTRARG